MDSFIHNFFSDHDRLSEEEARKLCDWVVADEANADKLVELLCIEREIQQVLRVEQAQNAMGLTNRREKPVLQQSAYSPWYRRSLAVALACGLLIGLIGYQWGMPDNPQEGDLANQLVVTPAVAATLSETRECVWANSASDYASGHLFPIGQDLELASGAVQLCFETGAVSIIEGPAHITLRENAMELRQGRVSAVVPKSATGFAVFTPTSEIIDLGTEFGVSVDQAGASQVHVFSGEVATRPRNAAGESIGEPIFVTTNNAIRFGPNSEQHQRLVADEAAFERKLVGVEGGEVNSGPPVDKPLLLWLRGDNWIIDEQQRVTVWRDTLCSSNFASDNAIQAAADERPKVIKSAFNGHSVVRFDGINDCLVTTPFHSGDNQTIVFVASINGTSLMSSHDYRASPQIINYNGPPQIDSNWISATNFPEILATAYREDRIALDSYVYVGFRSQGAEHANSQVFVGEVATERPIPGRFQVDDLPAVGEPFIGVYVYDMNVIPKRAELWINGQSAGWTSAPSPIAATSRKVIGRHGGQEWYFNGDIAEMMIYDEGLNADEVVTLTKSLAEKYGIAVPE